MRHVMPPSVTKQRVGRGFHSRAGALNPRLGQRQARASDRIILLPAGLLDRMGPGKREAICRQADMMGAEREADRRRREAHTAMRRPRRQRWKIKSAAPSAKPASSVQGTAATIRKAASVAVMRSAQLMAPKR